jgi:hypothetical protein
MEFGAALKKAMIDKGINGARELSKLTGVSYYITLRLLKNDGSCRLNDLVTVASYLDVEVKFKKGGES